MTTGLEEMNTSTETKPGQFIRHQTPPDIVWDEKGWEKSLSLEHLNGRVALAMMGLKDMKIWLREIESYLNFETRLDVRAHLESKISALDVRMTALEETLKHLNLELNQYEQKLDDALKEE